MPLSQQEAKRLFFQQEDGTFVWNITTRGKIQKGRIVGTIRPDGYVVVYVAVNGVREKWYGHRLAWLYHCGEPIPKYIDHINSK